MKLLCQPSWNQGLDGKLNFMNLNLYRSIIIHLIFLRCCLVEGLGHFNIAIPEAIRNMIKQNFKPESNGSLVLEGGAKVPSLTTLKSELESFLEPISCCLETLNFFEVFSKDSKLFARYVSYFFNKALKEAYNQCQDGSSERFIPLQSPPRASLTKLSVPCLLLEESTLLSLLKDAVLIVEGIIKKLVDGSATFAEVTLNGTLSFTHFDTKPLFAPVVQFAKFKKWGSIDWKTIDSIKNIQELNELAEQVMTINAVLTQFELKGCLQDQEYARLFETIQNVKKENLADISIKTASGYLQHISQSLNLNSRNRSQCLRLFSVVKESRPFYKFAVDKGFAGENGLKTFNEQCLFVSSHLEQEDYDMVVFSNLRGAMNVMMPFFEKKSNLRELVDKVASLHSISEGIQQLMVVNESMEMIKMWFHEAEVKLE